MRYSAAILLALVGLTAASVLHEQKDRVGRVHVNKRHHTVDDIDDDLNINKKYDNIKYDDLMNFNTKYDNIKYDDKINVDMKYDNIKYDDKINVDMKYDNTKYDDLKYDNIDSIENVNINRNHVDKIFLLKQKVVLQLLSNLQQKNVHQNLVELGNRFNPVEDIKKFNNIVAVKKFLKHYENNNFLPLDEVFTPTIQHHQNQAAQLFTFLYSAQDWNTLVKAAAWARDRFNTEQFAYVFTAVVLNHPTTQGIVIPALYEIIPHAFVPATALHKIYNARVQGYNQWTVKVNYTNQNRNNINFDNQNEIFTSDKYNVDVDKNVWGPHNPNTVFADNDGSIVNNAGTAENPENKLSYFTEDIGVNDLHARFHLQYPLFFGVNNNKNYYTSNLEVVNKNTIDNNKYDIRRGEAFYFAHQQLFARYVLERLSNNLPIPHPINLDDKIVTGFNPNLQHANGQAVPVRPPYTRFWQQQVEDNNDNINALLPNNNQAQRPQVYEKRIQAAAESGVVVNHDGTKTILNKKNAVGILANLIAAPASSLNPDYYGDYFSTAKHAIGNIVDPNNQNGIAPGVVSHYATAARDPAYYQLLAKLNLIFKNLQNKQGPYVKSELNFPGVKIEKVDVSNLVTFFDTVKVNVNNVVPTVDRRISDNVEKINDVNYNVKFQRLTNKPYNVRLTVLSEKNTNAIVRIFLGPKYDSNGQRFTLPQASQYFVQLDQFKVKLTNGENVIERHSQETNVNAQEPQSFEKLWKRVELALQGQQQFFVNKGEQQVLGLPLRAQLPKGKRHGQQFVLYVTINPLDNINVDDVTMDMHKVDSVEIMNEKYTDKMYDNIESVESTEGMKVNKKVTDVILNNIRDHRSIGFPLDRPVVDVNFNTANQYFKTVTIYHKVNNDN